MKSKKKSALILLALITAIALSAIGVQNFNIENDDTINLKSTVDINFDSSLNVDKISNDKIKPSTPSSKIHIVGNSGWADFKNQGKCTGGGTSSNPYVIQDLEIDAGGSGDCILIENSDVYFEIRDCELTGGSGTSLEGAGIRLVSVNNGKLINNDCSGNTNGIIITSDSNDNVILENTCNNNYWFGIHLRNNCDDNQIIDNTLHANKDGIYLAGTCTYNNISYNTVINSDYFSNILYETGMGVLIEDSCAHNFITHNLIYNSDAHGIWLDSNCNLCEISSNDVDNNAGRGIYLSSHTDNVVISGNNITNNGNNGIHLSVSDENDIIGNKIINNLNGLKTSAVCDDNEIIGNLVKDNTQIGVDLGENMVCSDNTLYENYFINNGQNAREYDHTVNTAWNSGTTGNFWDDYGGTDGNGDGIGDTPYDIPGFPSAVKNQDLYPIWSDKFIFIDDAGVKDWQWASAQWWCSGEGTSTNPYIIKDLYLDDTDFQYTNYIVIKNSNAYFKIQNCYMTSASESAIILKNVDNGVVTNCTSVNNGHRGIFMEYCNNINITDSNFINNDLNGIVFFRDCYNCNVLRNLIHSNYHGISIQYSDENVFSENEIYNHGFPKGIYGIYLSSGQNNLFFKNNLHDNDDNAKDSGSNNDWDNGQIGNFWDDYGGTDTNDDGIGDTPFNFYGTKIDNYPIFEDGDDAAPPIINILKPESNQIFGIKAPNFEISIDGLYLNKTFYSAIGGSKNYTFEGYNGQVDQDFWNGFGNGTVSLRFYANDSLGNSDFDDITVRKDIFAPTIELISPKRGELFGKIAPDFTICVNDTNLDAMWYSLDNGLTNITFAKNETFNEIEWGKLKNGTTTILFFVNDSGANINSSSVEVRIDIIQPEIKINSPKDNKAFENSPDFNVWISETHLHRRWYTLSANNTKHFFTKNGTINETTWYYLAEGPNNITFYANDTVGNLANMTVNIIKDTQDPIVYIMYPKKELFFNDTAPDFTVRVIDHSLNTTWYTLNNGKKTEFKVNQTFDPIEWPLLPNGTVTITFYANDSLSHEFSIEVQVKKDKFVPEITIISPKPDDKFGAKAPEFNITITESNLNYTWYTIDDNKTKHFITGLNGTLEDIWKFFGNGEITIYFWANDTAKNMGSNNVTITKYIAPYVPLGLSGGDDDDGGNGGEEAILGYDIIVIFAVISCATVVLIKKRYNQIK